jgi:hypothetical protein
VAADVDGVSVVSGIVLVDASEFGLAAAVLVGIVHAAPAAAGCAIATAPSAIAMTASRTGTDRGTRPRTATMVTVPMVISAMAIRMIEAPSVPVAGS